MFLTQNNFAKGLAEEIEFFKFIFAEIVENWKPLGYYYKCPRHDAFCTLIPGLLKFWIFF